MGARLTDTQIRQAKPGSTKHRLSDGDGLFLLVLPNGARWWRLDYRLHGRRNTISLGTYPEVSLAAARQRRAEARTQVAAGVDPSHVRQQLKVARSSGNTFAAVAAEWLAKQQNVFAPVTLKTATWQVADLVNPWMGNRPVGEIEPPELLAVLRRIEARGRHDTAHRVKQRCGQIFRYAIATGRAQRDPSADLRGALTPVNTRHRAAVTEPEDIKALLQALDGYQGTFVVACALRLAPLTFVRPGELRRAEWTEVNLERAEWRLPATKMKMREPHIVPLSTQAVELLRELQLLTGTGLYLFPSIRTRQRPMSENTINAALRRLGYATDQMCGHGFRAMASTSLNELGWPEDVIERQLAHRPRNKVRATYNRAQYLPERRRMMQAWANHLDVLRAGASSATTPMGSLTGVRDEAMSVPSGAVVR